MEAYFGPVLLVCENKCDILIVPFRVLESSVALCSIFVQLMLGAV